MGLLANGFEVKDLVLVTAMHINVVGALGLLGLLQDDEEGTIKKLSRFTCSTSEFDRHANENPEHGITGRAYGRALPRMKPLGLEHSAQVLHPAMNHVRVHGVWGRPRSVAISWRADPRTALSGRDTSSTTRIYSRTNGLLY